MLLMLVGVATLIAASGGEEDSPTGYGRIGEVPLRLEEIGRRPKPPTKMPQSLAGVRGISATPLHL